MHRNKLPFRALNSACCSRRPSCNWGSNVSRDTLYMIIGALVVVVAGFSYYAWQQEKKPDGVEIRLDQQGLSIEGN